MIVIIIDRRFRVTDRKGSDRQGLEQVLDI